MKNTANTITLSGGEGQHGKDIRFRETFSGIEVINREQGDILQANVVTHGIIIPISTTKQLIQQIMDLGQGESIINFSGIMSTTPESIRDNKGVENLHFLFGPGTNSGLKACLSHNNENLSPIMSSIIKNSRKQNIDIIETCTKTHDKNMAFVQGLHHLIRQIFNTNDIKLDISPIGTNLQTVHDMIALNPFMQGVLQKLNERIKNQGSVDLLKIFHEIINESLSQEDIEKFATPKCIETLDYGKKSRKGGNIETSKIHSFIENL